MAQRTCPIFFLSTLRHIFLTGWWNLSSNIQLLLNALWQTPSKSALFCSNHMKSNGLLIFCMKRWAQYFAETIKPLISRALPTVLLLPTSLIAHASAAYTKKHRPGQKQFLAPSPLWYMHFSLTILSTHGSESYSKKKKKVSPSLLLKKGKVLQFEVLFKREQRTPY